MNETKVNTKIGDVSSPAAKNVTLSPHHDDACASIALIHTDLGLTDDAFPWTFIRDEDGREYKCEGAEPVLQIIDQFNARDRLSLLAAAMHYGLPDDALMGRPMFSANEAAGGEQ